ncbi:MAG: hypothetical protein NTZ05_17160 [Chloroflexi bacterium]|nr:hypothetical protein [Chloroflexota bacterium]
MFSDLLRVWRQVLFHPSVATFEAAADGANFDRMVIGVALAAVAAGAGNFLNQVVFFILRATVNLDRLDPATAQFLLSLGDWTIRPTELMARGFINFVMIPPAYLLAFFGAAWVSWRLARAAGGTGGFILHAYLLSLSLVPLTLLGSLLGAVPLAGNWAGAALALYSFIPATSAVRAAHGLSGGRAVLALPIWLTAVLAVAAVYTVGAIAVLSRLISMAANRR